MIVDEIHAVAADKRGAHLALSLERLDALVERPLQRIGLSATQKPIEEVARLLVGTERIDAAGNPHCTIVDTGHKRDLELQIELPDQEFGPIVRHEIWAEVFDKIVAQVNAHRTTLVFVNTRRLVERVAHQLSERLGEDKVGAHHGSLSRKTRLGVEEKLKSGALPVVVATASLELGIDIGHVDVVCQIGSARSLGVLFQRVGRSGHWLGRDAQRDFLSVDARRFDGVRRGHARRSRRRARSTHDRRKTSRHPGPADGRHGGERRSTKKMKASRAASPKRRSGGWCGAPTRIAI